MALFKSIQAPSVRDFDSEATIFAGQVALQRWGYLRNELPGTGLFHSLEWIELLRRAYGLRFVAIELQRRGEPMAAALMAYPPPSWLSRRLCSLPFSDFCPPLEAEPGAAAVLMSSLVESGLAPRYELRGVAVNSPWEATYGFEHWQADCEQYRTAQNKVLGTAFRREVKRGQSEGLRVQRGTDAEFFDRYYRLQIQTRRRLGMPSQPRRFFHLLAELFGSRDLGEVWLASKNGIDHAGVVLLSEPGTLHFKWQARGPVMANGANHLLHWHIIHHHSHNYQRFDLGRAGRGNDGLSRWKRHLGARPIPLAYSYFPKAPALSNSEELSGPARVLSRVWSRLPLIVTEAVGTRLYPFFG
jgi:hypothetical protein